MPGGSIPPAMSPPASGPPRAVCTAVLSTAYCTARRQCTLSNGGTAVLIAAYCTKPVVGSSARALSAGSSRIFGWVAACTPPWPASASRVPSSSCRSISFGSVPITSSTRSGRARRTVSVARSQASLRTSTAPLPGSIDSNRYGPEATGLSPYFAPVSFAAGTGAATPIASRYGKSANGSASLNVTVLSSGVAMLRRPVLSAHGPR